MREDFEYLLKIFKRVNDNEYRFYGLAFANKLENGYKIVKSEVFGLPKELNLDQEITNTDYIIENMPESDIVFMAEDKEFLNMWCKQLNITLEKYMDDLDNNYTNLYLDREQGNRFKLKDVVTENNKDLLDFLEILFVDLAQDRLHEKQDINPEPERDNIEETATQTKIDVNNIIKEMKRKFVGQEDVIDSIVLNIYANQKLIDTKDKDLISTSKTSILLDGPTGTGKTAIIKEVADRLGLPVVITKSTAYSAIGYVGSDLSNILTKLLEKANGDLELAQRGIVCMDEFDKLGRDDKQNSLIMKEAVQEDLLTFIGGSTYDVSASKNPFNPQKQEFDTTNLTFVGMGAFTDLLEAKKKELTKNKMGIIGNNSEEETQKTYVIENKDYIEYGLIRELVGRLTLKTYTREYMKEDYKKILLTSEISPLKMFEKTVKALGIKGVTADEDFIDEISTLAYEMGTGVRGLQQIFSDIKTYYLRDIVNKNCDEIDLTVDVLDYVKEQKIRRF